VYSWLVAQTKSVEREPKLQALTPPFKKFWLRLQPSKIACAFHP